MLVSLMALTACGDPEPIRIGFVGTLSGRRSEIGVAARNAAQLKVDMANEAGGINGRPLELVIRDNTGEPEKCRVILEEMMAEGICFIVGPLFSQMAETVLQAVEGKDVLVMTPTMSSDYLSGRDDNLLRTCSTTTKQAVSIAERAEAMGLRKTVVVYDLSNRKYTELLYKVYREDAGKRGISVPLALTIDKTAHPEMLSLARRLMAVEPDSVLMCLSALDAANLSQQIRKLGGGMQLFGVSWTQTGDLIVQGGRAVEGMHLVAIRSYDAPGPELVNFNELYEQRYKQAPSFVSDRTYDALAFLTEGMRKSDPDNPAQVKRTLLEMPDFKGLSGMIRLDEFGDSLSGYKLVVVKDGQYIPVD